MARNIFCCKCGAYLGEIREATLAKGIKYMCRGCAAQKDIPDFLKGIFRGGKMADWEVEETRANQ